MSAMSISVKKPRLKSRNTCTSELDSLIAFVNPKSGGQKGQEVYEELHKYLPNENVFDINNGGSKQGLERHKHTRNLRIIVCGGDGTVGR
jgi:diacylglycerol kinase (ATP)